MLAQRRSITQEMPLRYMDPSTEQRSAALRLSLPILGLSVLDSFSKTVSLYWSHFIASAIRSAARARDTSR